MSCDGMKPVRRVREAPVGQAQQAAVDDQHERRATRSSLPTSRRVAVRGAVESRVEAAEEASPAAS